MNINLADVTLHIDDNLVDGKAESLEKALRAQDGVVSVHRSDDKPHLFLVDYDPQKVNSDHLLATARNQGLGAQLIGL